MSDPVSELKRELVAAADRQNGHAAVRFRRAPPAGKVRRHRLLLASAAVSLAAAVALVIAATWSGSPTFLERAEAALTPPADTVLHMKWEVTSKFEPMSSRTDPACSVIRGPNEIWIDLAPPHTYRAILDDLPAAGSSPRSLACSSGTVREVGGKVDLACSPIEQTNCTTQDTLEFEPPSTLNVSPLQFVLPPDPVTMLREAISAGNAHDEGRAQLNGRSVERVRIDAPRISDEDVVSASACAFPSCAFGHVYVEPETFHPIEMRAPPLLVMPPPDDGVVILPPAGHIVGASGRFDDPVARIDVVDRYLTFEYLPRTEANLALTDIRAQHPDATEIEE
jgi:hypothetical protein